MPHRFQFSSDVLHSVAGGRSAIDLPKLNIKTQKEAEAFVNGYGFDIKDSVQIERLWYFHRRSLVLIEEKLGFTDKIPEVLRDRKQLGDICKLLLLASSTDPSEKELQRWSCAILRVMHVFVHTESDLFASFSEEIQKQILTPFQQCIFHEGKSGKTFLQRAENSDTEFSPLALVAFEVKPFKTSSSTVIKLLAKPDALATNVFDRLGVRFVTESMFDAFRVIRFLVEENLIGFPHIIPDQSSNNLYPVDLFCAVSEELNGRGKNMTDEQIEQFYQDQLVERKHEVVYLRKENSFSGDDYKFIKFIARKLIHIQGQGKEGFSFFFPFEVQIMDKMAHQKILSGPSQHKAYKERQKMGARKRVAPGVD